jgi:hypothetical protein
MTSWTDGTLGRPYHSVADVVLKVDLARWPNIAVAGETCAHDLQRLPHEVYAAVLGPVDDGPVERGSVASNLGRLHQPIRHLGRADGRLDRIRVVRDEMHVRKLEQSG